MLFNSFSYLIFFPIVVLIHFMLPHRVRYIWLLVTSYYFYMCWNPKYSLLMAASTLITYLAGLLIGRENDLMDGYDRREEGQDFSHRLNKSRQLCILRKKIWIFLSFASNLTILFFFKYFDFAVTNINVALGRFNMALLQPEFDVVLPVGISFYIFQALSYSMDLYRREIYVEKNPFKYALFVSFFPQLVAGPIERSKNLLIQVSQRHSFDFHRMRDGLLLILWGIFLKLVIADRVAILVNQVYNNYGDYVGLQIAIATIAFGIQIYCDFSSYSYIAIGSAQVLGFKLMENFRQPYFARSITEFWQRWHISLSTWFRDYLYVPLGGNRKGTLRKYLNIIIVFLVSGFWHGASWTFIIWGLLHGVFQVIGQMTRPFKNKIADSLSIRRDNFSYQFGQGVITFLLVNFAWIFFRAPDYTSAKGIITQLFAEWNPWIFSDGSIFLLGLSKGNVTVLIIALCALIFGSVAGRMGIQVRQVLSRQGVIFRWIAYFLLIIYIMVFGVYGPGYSESQFIYFQF